MKQEQQLRAILVDDEPGALNLLQDMLDGIAGIRVIASFTDPVQALLALKEDPPDVLFLDIQMPQLTGFDVMRSIRKSGMDLQVVFVTAYDQYAIEALHQEAFDYLLKPVSPEELRDAVCRLASRLAKHAGPGRIDQLLERTGTKKIMISDRNGACFYFPAEIYYLEANGNYCLIHMKGRQHVVTRQIGDMEEMLLPLGFLRISRSYMINTLFLVRIDRRNHTCVLDADGQEIELPVSEERIKGLI